MNTNPCLTCPKIDEDKNNAECLQCEQRIHYVRQLSRALDGCIMYADDAGDLNVHCPADTPLA